MIARIPGSEFNVTVHAEGSAEVVVVHGEVDLATADALRAEVRLARERARSVVLDLRDVAFMDTQGLAVVIEAQQSAAEDGSNFAITRAPDQVHRLFDMIGLTPRLTIVDDPAAAAS
jgi:stage II sporulation protein AA (anti-sigma F factor antagonist)